MRQIDRDRIEDASKAVQFAADAVALESRVGSEACVIEAVRDFERAVQAFNIIMRNVTREEG